MSFEYHYLQEEKPETDNKPKPIKKPKNSNKQTSTSTQDSSYSIDFSQICLLNNSETTTNIEDENENNLTQPTTSYQKNISIPFSLPSGITVKRSIVQAPPQQTVSIIKQSTLTDHSNANNKKFEPTPSIATSSITSTHKPNLDLQNTPVNSSQQKVIQAKKRKSEPLARSTPTKTSKSMDAGDRPHQTESNSDYSTEDLGALFRRYDDLDKKLDVSNKLLTGLIRMVTELHGKVDKIHSASCSFNKNTTVTLPIKSQSALDEIENNFEQYREGLKHEFIQHNSDSLHAYYRHFAEEILQNAEYHNWTGQRAPNSTHDEEEVIHKAEGMHIFTLLLQTGVEKFCAKFKTAESELSKGINKWNECFAARLRRQRDKEKANFNI